jgi:hypothetical protein
MKPIRKETLENGTILITTEESFLFGLIKKQIKYSSNKIIVGKFRSWLKEPDKLLVPDQMSFQLDEWCEVL